MGTAHGKAFLPRSAARPRASGDADERAIVVVGAPRSAVRAAAMFLVGMPEGFSLPLVLALGGAAEDHRDLGVNLQAHSALPVRTIDDKDPLVGGRVHLAPADYHLLVEDNHFALSTAAPVNGARPSLDVLFESVADTFGAAAVCVLLGSEDGAAAADDRDGREGAERVRARGGLVIVQNPTTAVVGGGRPQEAIAADAATVLHLSEIAPFVSRLGDLELT